MDILSRLFESTKGEARIKILRFLLSNLDQSFESKEIADRLKLKTELVRKEVNSLSSIELIQKESYKNNKNLFYTINQDFDHIESLYNLLFDFKNINKKNIFEKFKKIGRIKVFVFAGVFVDELEDQVDILVVADILKQKEVEKVLNDMYISFGRELKILVMDIDEYNYRYKMFDKILHTVLNGTRIDYVNKL